jgi:catalase
METIKKAAASVVHSITDNRATMPGVMTMATGCPIAHNKNSLTAGPTGPVLMQDIVLQEKIGQFAREKIPARNVHALGFGAHGTFTVTNDISKHSYAKVFSAIGKKTEVFVRFSGVFTEQGDPDTIRDLRGFAVKFYTEEGNWDVLCVNTPVFNARDMKVGPDAIHAFKRDPRTAEWNPTQTWDFIATHPESLHNVLMIYTDRVGTPLSFRQQNWFPCNTFSFINSAKKRFWIRFHFISEQGWKGMTQDQGFLLAGEDPNFLSREMRQAIEKGMFPRWKLCYQVMSEEEGYAKPQLAFDCTKAWPHEQYPLIDIGVLEVNKFAQDYFAEVEQVAFSPAVVPPGISFSPDKLLQGRLMLYDVTQHHRLGPNFKQIPINEPKGVVPNTMYTGGAHRHDLKPNGGWPHYSPSLFGGLQPNPAYIDPPMKIDGAADFYDMPGEGSDSDYYGQARDFLKVTTAEDRSSLIENLSTSLHRVADRVVTAILAHFNQIEPAFATAVRESILMRKNGSKATPGNPVLKQFNQQLLGDANMDINAA